MVYEEIALPMAALDNAHIFQTAECLSNRISAQSQRRHQLPFRWQLSAKGDFSFLNQQLDVFDDQCINFCLIHLRHPP